MWYRFSNLDSTISKWIKERCEDVDRIVHDKLSMNRRELETQKDRLRKLGDVYAAFKKLHKGNNRYDVVVIIDSNGNVDYRLIVPVTHEERMKALENKREKVKRLNCDWCCVYLEEEIWNVIKERVINSFPMLTPEIIHLNIKLTED